MKNMLAFVFSLALPLFCTANVFRVTPYVQNPAPDAMTIVWFAQGAGQSEISYWEKGNPQSAKTLTVMGEELGTLDYSAGESSGEHQYLPYTVPFRHKIRLTGLEPDTEYSYSVALPGGANYSNAFKTAPAAPKPIRFVCYADSETQPSSNGSKVTWDDYALDRDESPATTRKYYVTETIGYSSNLVAMASRSPDFYVIAGDLVQTGSQQSHWDEFWRHNAGELGDDAGRAPIFAAIGNHEYSDYQADGGERGARKFLSYFESPPTGLDLPAGQEGRFYRMDYGPATLIFLDLNNGPDRDRANSWQEEYRNPHPEDTNAQLREETSLAPDFRPGSAQYRWLEEQLKDAQSGSLFTFVVSHQCPYSAGYHGRAPGEVGSGGEGETLSGTPARALVDLLLKYGCDGWIAGHDEMYEHSRITGKEILPDGSERETSLDIYDIGIGGDGLRGCRITEAPNPYEVFRAHVDAPEVYDERGILVEGGKHYGHLEVEIDKNSAGEWQATLSPVYVFVSTNEQGNATGFERRVYDDVVVKKASLAASPLRANASVKRWTGLGADNLASNPDNWDGGIPQTGDGIELLGGNEAAQKAMTYDAGMKDVVCAYWLQDGYTNSVTFETVFEDKGDFLEFSVSGDVTIKSGRWTTPLNYTGRDLDGSANGGSNINKFRLKASIGGNLAIFPEASIDVTGCGYAAGRTPAGATTQFHGGSYGGPGGRLDGALGSLDAVYGSITEPVHLGAAGNWGLAGGAIYLTVGGNTALDGAIRANARYNSHYSGSGGSIFLRTSSIEGGGTLESNSSQTRAGGSGGRIAVILTGDGAKFDRFDILNNAFALSSTGSGRGASGTIYAQTKQDGAGKGWLIMKGNGHAAPNANREMRPGANGLYGFSKITVTNCAVLNFTANETVNLSQTEIVFKDVPGVKNGIAFSGGSATMDEGIEDIDIALPVRVDDSAYPFGAYAVNVLQEGSLNFNKGNIAVATLRNSGAVSLSGATLAIEKELAQNGDFSMSDDSVLVLRPLGEDVRISGSVAASTINAQSPGKKILFADGASISVSKGAIFQGTSAGLLSLLPLSQGGTWSLSLSSSASKFFQYLSVGGSNAAMGERITAYMSGDLGGNSNWVFDQTGERNAWLGTSSADFFDAENWSSGVPGDGASIEIDSANPVVISRDWTFGDVTLGGGAHVTFDAKVDLAGSLVVTNATLVWNCASGSDGSSSMGTVGGDFIVRDGGVVTHGGNTDKQLVWFDVFVNGDVAIDSGGAIDATGKGYSGNNRGPGAPLGNRGSSHGGRGWPQDGNATPACYGSIYCPTNLGSSGNWGGPGGGAIKLFAQGTMTVNGEIKANGGKPASGGGHYDGTGGSVYLKASHLFGNGAIMARNYNYESGGGRVAVYLTAENAAFGDFLGNIDAKASGSSAGTVYLETFSDGRGGGRVIIDNSTGQVNSQGKSGTDFPSSRLCAEEEFSSRNGTRLEIGAKGNILVTKDCHVKDVNLSGNGPGHLRLNGYTLKVNSRRHDIGAPGSFFLYDPGSIFWCVQGTKLLLR